VMTTSRGSLLTAAAQPGFFHRRGGLPRRSTRRFRGAHAV
jgi:hypothetical protein